uniref:DNA polymerase n=1 Tax=Anopheles epiroticus TaxID=199890 RepID=A0A182PJ53_9DIPT
MGKRASNERELYEKFLLLISFWDPDIFAGYEIESAAWGYVIERGYALEMNLMKRLSRVPSAETVQVSEEEQRELLEMQDYSAGLKIPGRILLDIWRLMRHEIALTSYTFENVVYHILHRRVPNHSYRQLSRLWRKSYSHWVVLEYYLERVNGNFEILNQLDLIGRTAELAKLFGIQFYEVLSRGSQFRVESMMLRIAKPRNFVSVSPSIHQRAHMRAPEYLPLILEPNSRFYADPIIVLDFQSLYPSVIIAYNYCFSTCLGRIEHLGKDTDSFEFGASRLRVPPKMLQALLDKNLVTFSPCGVAFVKKRVREGVLPRMLSEILNTRLMVKKSMKLHKDNSILQRVLHSRQLGLKLIANVTYGYTAANFSGRMPCVEIGDSVVAKGRETLERAIKLVEETERWGAKVVYGDTDSLFVLCPGRSKEEAFKIGEEIAEAVTKENPPPVKLKLEKVYQPSILQTKKRYVGYMYESADQAKPIYEAKGIETVRRDGCPVVAKMLEKVLRILFETCDVSKVKQYTCRQFTKILEGRVNLQDFIFAKEFRGESGYKPGACVPALELMRKWKLTDPRREPRQGQRVPYVIINGPPLVPLIRLVRSPDELLSNEGLKINANYYIVKAIIPPLNRCLLLIGADANQWYNELPRKTLMLHNTGGVTPAVKALAPADERMHKKITISQYFSTTNCIVDCGRQTHHGVCKDCRQQPQRVLVHVMNKVNKLERKLELTEKMCRSCCQRSFETTCISLDCPVVFSLNRRALEYKQAQYYRDLIEELF